MRRLNIASYALTAIGILMVLAASILSLDAWIILAGVLLAWAGIVKIAVVLIWTRVAGMETSDHKPISDA
ncbi:MAG: hypothetical protein AVDCRST_MAG43-825 [uncultured Thermomicrobiales bacterium]|uniref:Uncharacterized protein n=1 Tax=uncultured Thermomicrobiales bacterium TaxID=1645740 RepID=A0A6J4UI34_9BACT|nr:MAG: hypothetical protein AVDCRST_MAG43-825 [uncultured Thermomicrobiales bacterium]